MKQIKIFIRNSWKTIVALTRFKWDNYRLDLAVFWADYKHKISRSKERFFVLPNQDERLLVLSVDDIVRLKKVGKVVFRNVIRRKNIYRRKNGVKRFKKIRATVIGRKAFGISMMRQDVGMADLFRESFYYTPGLSPKEIQAKRDEWIRYMQIIRLKRKETYGKTKRGWRVLWKKKTK